MRKQALLVTIVMSLLLVGCVGSGTLPLPNPPIGPGPTDPDEIFDGSPTHLSLEVQRNDTEIQAFTLLETLDEVAYARITRMERGHQIYSELREVNLVPSVSQFSIDTELPAEQNYAVKIVVSNDKGQLLELGVAEKINAPANTLTSVPISLTAPSYTLTKPEVMYSEGGLSQWSVEIPNDFRNAAWAHIYVGLTPWTKNGHQGIYDANPWGERWVIPGGSGFVPQVTEPTKLYYQVGIAVGVDNYPDGEPEPNIFDPDIEQGEELSYIWIYPYPGWGE
jgi:hypothetical protein